MRGRYHKQIIFISLIISIGFSISAVVTYSREKSEAEKRVLEESLPLIGDSIYTEIQSNIMNPVDIATFMAHDSFVRDWIIDKNSNPTIIRKYLRGIKEKYNATTAFLVDDAEKKYYTDNGSQLVLHNNTARDSWYWRVLADPATYELNLGKYQENDSLLVFANEKIFDDQGKIIGIVGISLELHRFKKIIDKYADKYNNAIYIFDQSGNIIIRSTTSTFPPHFDFKSMNTAIHQDESVPHNFLLQSTATERIVGIRKLPGSNWYLAVEEDVSETLANEKKSMIETLLVSIISSIIVILSTTGLIYNTQRKLFAAATTDPLTGLLNRNAFHERIRRQRKRHGEQAFLLAMIDIDHFKAINDSHGHQVGDEVIRDCARALREAASDGDILARWGGEEFLLFSSQPDGCDENRCHQWLDDIRANIAARRINCHGVEMCVTVSIGYTLAKDSANWEQLLEVADQALYAAKQAGRNRVMAA
jgi:diguanylate cyclase (GGDEF)-like protein